MNIKLITITSELKKDLKNIYNEIYKDHFHKT